jgi:hypothetical protein
MDIINHLHLNTAYGLSGIKERLFALWLAAEVTHMRSYLSFMFLDHDMVV